MCCIVLPFLGLTLLLVSFCDLFPLTCVSTLTFCCSCTTTLLCVHIVAGVCVLLCCHTIFMPASLSAFSAAVVTSWSAAAAFHWSASVHSWSSWACWPAMPFLCLLSSPFYRTCIPLPLEATQSTSHHVEFCAAGVLLPWRYSHTIMPAWNLSTSAHFRSLEYSARFLTCT